MAEAHLNILEKKLARCKSHLNYNEIGDTRIDLTRANGDRYRLVGSSNGLVCIREDNAVLFVVNPSTNEVVVLSPPKGIRSIQVMGFGYDSSIDDFKVVVGFYSDYKVLFKVLALKSNVWKSIAGEVEGGPLYEYGDTYGTLYNGVIHWLFRGKVIVTFDLSKDVIIKIPQPDPPCERLQGSRLESYKCTLGTIKDHLCIKYQKTEETEIWVMRNYNVINTEGIEMERWLPPPGYDEYKTKMNYTPHEIFFYGHVHIWMLEEGSGDAELVASLQTPGWNSHIKLSTISECNYNFDLPVYVKSLKSPHDMDDDTSSDTSSSSSDHHHTKSCETLEEC